MQVDKMVEDFVKRFPGLQTTRGSFGKCKFISYELALFLRRRGIKAVLIHVQGLTPKHQWLKTAHATWVGKPRKEWSHYVVGVEQDYYDCTARQFDRALPFPVKGKRSELRQAWTTVETDTFLNGIVTEVLQAQTDANRSLREGQVRKTNTTPQEVTQLKSPVQQAAALRRI